MSTPFIVRRAQPADRGAVTDLCRAIDPKDWVPEDFDEFLAQAEPEGLHLAHCEDRRNWI